MLSIGLVGALPSSGTVWLALATLVLVFCGCSNDGKVNVSGTVSVAGQSVDQGTIRFEPADGQGPTDGATIASGKYSVDVNPGSKKVHIEGHRQVGLEKQNPDDPSSPMLPVYEKIVDADVTADVSSSNSGLDFDLPAP